MAKRGLVAALTTLVLLLPSAPAAATGPTAPDTGVTESGDLHKKGPAPADRGTTTTVIELDHGLGEISEADLKAARLLTEDTLNSGTARAIEIATTAVDTQNETTISVSETDTSSTRDDSGSLRRGRCYNIRIKKSARNWFGVTLYSATQILRNVCWTGSTFSPEPTSQRAFSAAWGWTHCGWNAEYGGWTQGTTVYGAGGQARFAYASQCWATTGFIGVEVEVDASDGTWETTSY